METVNKIKNENKINADEKQAIYSTLGVMGATGVVTVGYGTLCGYNDAKGKDLNGLNNIFIAMPILNGLGGALSNEFFNDSGGEFGSVLGFGAGTILGTLELGAGYGIGFVAGTLSEML